MRDIDITGKRNEIMELERKMRDLDKRMNGINVVDDDDN